MRLQNSPGALGRVCRLLGDAKIGIQAMSLDTGGTLRLVVDNPLGAVGILLAQDYAVDQQDILYVHLPNGPGALSTATRLLSAAAVNVDRAYCSAVDGEGLAAVVVGVDDPQRAASMAGL